MATVTICDHCKEAKPTPFKVTEKDGAVYDLCSATCYQGHVKTQEAK